MPYCVNCGKQISEDTKFCPHCGTKTDIPSGENLEKRKETYAGEIRKCPNCGEVLSAFEIKCHSCGFELRNVKASAAIQEFYQKIVQIESQRNECQEGETEKSIANVIRNFPVPNTKEDVLEFMMLAASNIDTSLYSVQGDRKKSKEYQAQKIVNDAWCATAEQTYHKAKLSFENDPDFSAIQELYTHKIKSIRLEKQKGTLNIFGSGVSKIFSKMGMLIHKEPAILILLLLPLLPLLIRMSFGTSNYFDNKEKAHHEKEKQLEAIVVEIQDCIANENYDTAFIKAQGLYMDDNWSSESTERWDKVRKDLIDLIETKSGVSYTSGTSLPNQEDTPTSNSSEEGYSSSSSVKDTLDETREVLGESIDTVTDSFKNAFSGIFD